MPRTRKWGQSRRRVFTADERVGYVRRARQLIQSQGWTIAAAAAELGLGESTLSNWLRRSSASQFLPVAIMADSVVDGECVPVSQRPVLVAPGGYRVEGLDVDGLAELLRRLS